MSRHPLAQALADGPLRGAVNGTEAQQEAAAEAVAASWEKHRAFRLPEEAVFYALARYRFNMIPKPSIKSIREGMTAQANDLRGIRKDRTTRARKRLADCVRAIRKHYGNSHALSWALVRIEGKPLEQVAHRFNTSPRTLQRRFRQAEDYLRAIA